MKTIDGGIHVEHRADPERGRYKITTRSGREIVWADTLNINGDRPFAFGGEGPGAIVEFGADNGTTTTILLDDPRGKNDGPHATIHL
ncbi:hypothetical protein M1M38_gp093 [Halorubrum tailed virus 27]|uniref:Uncharacterized protein n=1 Tax=Halorubrum tailed virus 27 TaxID=2878008 RepID=A0AAE8XYI8_9CAUD|nr:hypothetical protein M1M38_gp093 [Halorubrum tailed virus 27]UBF22786.1 hypothetical protein HRTV-27_gp93 [Halorubrum tailed virus 27]